MITVVSKVLARDNVKALNPENGNISVIPDDIIYFGSYNENVVKNHLLGKDSYGRDRKRKNN